MNISEIEKDLVAEIMLAYEILHGWVSSEDCMSIVYWVNIAEKCINSKDKANMDSILAELKSITEKYKYLYKSNSKPTKNSDNVNRPSHYNKGGIECLDAIEVAVSNLTGIEAVCTANAIKYLWRWKDKGGIEDLKKAIFYINHIIKKEDNNVHK